VNITPRASEALRAAAGAAPSKTDEINKAIQAYALITGLLKEHDDSKPTFRVL
jgi:hypothetical protein